MGADRYSVTRKSWTLTELEEYIRTAREAGCDDDAPLRAEVTLRGRLMGLSAPIGAKEPTAENWKHQTSDGDSVNTSEPTRKYESYDNDSDYPTLVFRAVSP